MITVNGGAGSKGQTAYSCTYCLLRYSSGRSKPTGWLVEEFHSDSLDSYDLAINAAKSMTNN